MRSLLLSVGVVCALAMPAMADISASGKVTLTSVTGPTNNKTYNYQIDLKNIGDTEIGTFWYAWVPGYDYLPNMPTITGTPDGWYPYPQGMGPPDDGYSIEWFDYTGNPLEPGKTFTFKFSSPDSPQVIGSGYTQTSYVYIGQAMGDPGFMFMLPAVIVPEPGSLGVLGAGAMVLMRRGRRVRRRL